MPKTPNLAPFDAKEQHIHMSSFQVSKFCAALDHFSSNKTYVSRLKSNPVSKKDVLMQLNCNCDYVLVANVMMCF